MSSRKKTKPMQEMVLEVPTTEHPTVQSAVDEAFKLEPGELREALGPEAAKRLLVEDGLPPAVIKTKEEREEAWKLNPPKEPQPWKAAPKETPADVAAFAEAEAERKKAKAKGRIDKMKAKQETPDPKTHRWNARKNVWEKMDGTPADPKRTAKEAAANLRAAKAATKKGKARVEKPAKPLKPKKAVAQKEVSTEGHSAISIECGVKSTNRRSILDYLVKHIGKQQPEDEVIKAVYGADGGSSSSLNMVFKGLAVDFDRKKPKYEIKKEKTEKGITYGLYAKA